MSLDLLGPASAPGAVTTRPGEIRSFGASDTFFKDCSSALVDDGTEFQAAWFNQMLAIARSLARGNGQTVAAVDIVTQDNADDSILLKAVQHLLQRGLTNYAADTGTANAIAVALTPAPAELKSGLVVRFKKSANPNTGASTLTLNSFAPKPVVRMDGTALQVGDLPANVPVEAEYDLATDSWYVLNFNGNYVANGPFSEVNLFTQGSGALSVPSATYTKAAFGSATIGAHGDVALVSGSCKIVTPGRYLITSTAICGVVPASFYVLGQYPCAIMKNLSVLSNGTGFVNDASGSPHVKEVSGSNVFVADFAANDIIDAAIYQASSGGAAATMTTNIQFSIVRVR